MKNSKIKTVGDMHGLSVAFLNFYDGLTESQYPLFSKLEDNECPPIIIDRLGVSPVGLRDIEKKKIDVLVIDTASMTYGRIKEILDEFLAMMYLPKHVVFTGGSITHPSPLMYDLNHHQVDFHMFDMVTKELTPVVYGNNNYAEISQL